MLDLNYSWPSRTTTAIFCSHFACRNLKRAWKDANLKPDLERHAGISDLKSAMFGICKRLGPWREFVRTKALMQTETSDKPTWKQSGLSGNIKWASFNPQQQSGARTRLYCERFVLWWPSGSPPPASHSPLISVPCVTAGWKGQRSSVLLQAAVLLLASPLSCAVASAFFCSPCSTARELWPVHSQEGDGSLGFFTGSWYPRFTCDNHFTHHAHHGRPSGVEDSWKPQGTRCTCQTCQTERCLGVCRLHDIYIDTSEEHTTKEIKPRTKEVKLRAKNKRCNSCILSILERFKSHFTQELNAVKAGFIHIPQCALPIPTSHLVVSKPPEVEMGFYGN